MSNKEYNGWTNYETWAVALWLDNEEGSQRYWNERAQNLADELQDSTSAYARLTGTEIFTLPERIAFKLADELKAEHEEANPVGSDATIWADLMNAALSEVNWQEIAKHYADAITEVSVEVKREVAP